MSTAAHEIRWGHVPARRINPRAADHRALAAGLAMLRAMAGVKPESIGPRIRRSGRTVRRWFAGDTSNPLHVLTEIAMDVPNPEELIVHLRVTAMRRSLKDMSRAELERELDDLTREREPAEQYAEDCATQAWRDARTDRERLLALAEAQEREAAVQVRIAAIARLLAEPG
jgi:hypothetical protein